MPGDLEAAAGERFHKRGLRKPERTVSPKRSRLNVEQPSRLLFYELKRIRERVVADSFAAAAVV
jgi:hypothetical protein